MRDILHVLSKENPHYRDYLEDVLANKYIEFANMKEPLSPFFFNTTKFRAIAPDKYSREGTAFRKLLKYKKEQIISFIRDNMCNISDSDLQKIFDILMPGVRSLLYRRERLDQLWHLRTLFRADVKVDIVVLPEKESQPLEGDEKKQFQ